MHIVRLYMQPYAIQKCDWILEIDPNVFVYLTLHHKQNSETARSS